MNSRKYPYFARIKEIVLSLTILCFSYGLVYSCPTPTATLPIMENFESNSFAYWTQDAGDDFDWVTHTGSTTSGSTGPSGAYNGSYYAYTEATTPNNPNKVANLISPCFNIQSGLTTEISFAYHMYGNGMGSFGLDISTNDGSTWTNLWSLSGNQGNSWQTQTINLDTYVGQNVKLRFNVVTNTYQSDVSIDDVVISTSTTQEVCNNGIDDDLDGLVDGFDPDCPCDEGLYYGNCPSDCDYIPPVESNGFDLIKDWTSTDSVTNISQLFVADVDNDDIPEIATIRGIPYHSSGVNLVMFLDGTNGTLKYRPNTLRIHNRNKGMALADTDRDGNVEFFYVTADDESTGNSRKIVCYEFNPSGTNPEGYGSGNFDLRWISDTQVTCGLSGDELFATEDFTVSLADFNYDGIPEVYVGNEIYNSSNGQKITDGGFNAIGSWNHGDFAFTYHVMAVSVAVDVLPDNACANCAGLELVAGNNVYSVDISSGTMNVEKTAPNSLTDGNTAIVDYDLDGDLDAIITSRNSSNSFLYIWDLQTETQIGGTHIVQTTSSLFYHPVNLPIVADFDGDNRPEIGVCGNFVFQVVEDHLTDISGSGGVLWSITTTDNSGQTGASVFDFNGDGISEVVYRDEDDLRIISGPTGANLATFPCGSGTGGEYSVIADIDNDGETEIICNCSDDPGDSNTPSLVNAFKSNLYPWVPTRKLWNQYAYFNVNINDDLTIPTQQQLQHKVGEPVVGTSGPLNIFLKQISPIDTDGNEIYPAADMALNLDATEKFCDKSNVQFDLTIENNGDVNVPSNLPITIYRSNPQTTNASILTTVNTNSVILKESQAILNVSLDLSAESTPLTLFLVVNDDGSHARPYSLSTDFPLTNIGECDFDNNVLMFDVLISELSASIQNNGSNCLTSNTELTATQTGGIAPLSYNWSGPNGFSSTSDVIDANNTGTYYLTITDAYNCESSESIDIFDSFDITITPSDSDVCEGETVNLVVNGTNIVNYTWDSNAGNASTNNVDVIPSVPSSTYTVTATNNLGCTNTASVTINVSPTPTAYAGEDVNICALDTVVLGGDPDFSATNNGFLLKATNEGSATDNIKFTKNGLFGPRLLVYKLGNMFPSTIYATQRARLESDNTDHNHDDPQVGYDGDEYNRSLLQFDLSGVTGVVTKVDLRLVATTSGNLDISVYPVSEAWDEDDVSWDESDAGVPWTIPGVYDNGDYLLDTKTVTSTMGYSWDVTEAAMKWMNQYQWSNGETTEAITVYPSVSTTYTLTVTNVNGCSATDQVVVNANPKPTIDISGPNALCSGTSIVLSSTVSGGIGVCNYQWESSPDNLNWTELPGETNSTLSITNQIVDTYYRLKYTCSGNSFCPEPYSDSHFVSASSSLSVDIDYSGTLCLEDNTELTAVVTGGTAPFQYSWTGPNSISGSSQMINIPESGNYSVTVTDSQGCTGQFSAYVYEAYAPFIFALNTEVCEGENVTLTINSSSAVQFNWGPNAGNATTSSVTVTPSPPSTDYMVTVTNDQGCSAVATATIDVIARPVVNVTGPSPICEGETTMLSPTAGGSWISTNSAIATVSNSGVVTGISAGSVSFIFTDATTGCESLPTTALVVNPKPTVSVTGPTSICEGLTSQLSPITGGVWTSNDTNVATVTDNGVVTAVGEGSTTFIFTDNSTGCPSNATQPITVNSTPIVDVTGSATICEGSTTTLSPTSGGTWMSSNSSVATVSNGGVVLGISEGTATFTFTSIHGCVSSPSEVVTVEPESNVTISGSSILCEGESTTLTASSNGGTWSSSNSSIAIVNSSGVVTAVSTGSVTITYDYTSATCFVSPTFGIEILDQPTVFVSGATTICVGESTQLNTSGTGGFWASSDPGVAIVSSSGIVVGTGAGTVSFTYTSSNGCESEATGSITVDPSVEVEVDFNGSLCLTDDSQLSAIATGGTPGSSGFTYSWSGPGGFSSTLQTIDIAINGNYNLTVTDSKGCSSNTTAFVYEAYEPFIFALNTEVCEGEEVTLSVNSSAAATYQWGANAGNATTQSVTVTPGVPTTSYSVTVTNSIGCTTEATADIDVDPKPIINITGPTSICQNGTSQLTPMTGGNWTSSDYSVATVNNSGLVTGISEGTATFTFRADDSGCFSDPSAPITVTNNETITITGENQICIGDNPTLVASVAGGTWTSSNVGVAQINSSGVITPNSQGSAIITYIPSPGNCYFDATYEINVHESPNLSINGPSTICENDVTFLSASTSGVWTSSDPAIASVSSTGVVTGMSAGTVTFSFVSSAGCPKTLGTPITVIGNPIVSLNGPGDICVNSTTSLLPNTGGVWITSNSNVATVSSTGIVTGISPGIAMFTFIEYTHGCTSENMISVNVNDDPNINGLADDNLCIGESTSITPSTGGTWSSSNEAVALIDDNGNITAVGAGSATFTYTNTLTGCTSDASMPLTVNSNPETNFNGPTSICVGETSSISPSSGGVWGSTNVSIATITSDGIITAVSPGTVQFIFTNSTTGCTSDASENLTVEDPTEIQITGPSNICVGSTTTLSPTSGGTWSSSNENIATIANNGTVTGVAPGSVTFTFNSTAGCTSNPSTEITIEPKPITNFVGPSSVCIGSTTMLSPSTGGTWTSSNTAVATVTNGGIVTGVSPGTANFTFVNSTTGCSATTETILNVYGKPTISISGEDEICIGGMTNMLPSSGGIWVSSDNTVATITASGVVIGLNAGTVTFTFYESGTGCLSDASDPITVLPKPVVSITGDNILCEGETTTLSPSSGGSWTSDNESVATVTDQGVVTGHSQGLVKFTFTSNEGCVSEKTAPVIVYGKPSIVLDSPNILCTDETGQMLPSSGGMWTSTNPSVATIDNNGVFTAVSSGTVRFIFTDNATGCASDESDEVTVNENPVIAIIGPSNICIGGVTNLVPTDGGVWMSLNPNIATIQNNGEVIGISSGLARFIFTNVNTGCVSDTSSFITVDPGPDVNFTGPQELCIGENSSISPSTNGTWMSTDNSVATIDNNGIITAVGQGSVKFIYTETATGCSSDLSETLTVNGPPTVSVSGPSEICAGGSTTLSPVSGGSWTSLQPGVATVDQFGNVTGVSPGTAYFVFTDNATGCESDGTLNVTILDGLDVEITGDVEICIGYTTTLSPSAGGFWTSSNPEIASVTNSGIVTGKAPGVVTFEFTDGTTGCSANGPTDPVTVELCTNHDFNVTLANLEIQGDISTNDNVPAGTTYSNATVQLEKPIASIPVLTINSDGTYTFTTNKEGKYLYRVPVCIPPMVNGCPGTYLEINVVDNIYTQSNIVANLEFATTYTNPNPLLDGTPVSMDAVSNDDCVNTIGCTLEESTISVIGGPENGSASVNATGILTYTPNPGFIGKDTIYYSVCEDGVPTNCDNSLQVVTVNDNSALNSTVAADDFNFTFSGIAASGNVMSNDSDPEGHIISVLAQGSSSSPIVTPQGSYYIEADGTYSFTPTSGFTGATEIVYTLCDNGSDLVCTDATLHLLVFDDISIKIRVYLEGALMLNGGEFSSSSGLPLMRDDLRVSPFTGENYIPVSDPYTFVHDNFVNTPAMFLKLGPGLMSKNTTIVDSAGVFSVTGDNAIVDWVHVELRSKDDYTSAIATRSGLVQRDGDVVDLDGVSDLRFDGVNVDSFYVVVKHRSHLGVMSMKVANDELVDFTDPNFPVFNYEDNLDANDYTGLSQKANVVAGYMALWAGDFDSNGQVKFTNPGDDVNVLFLDVLFSSPDFLINYNNAIGYFTGDYNMNSKAKYTNPDDDINYLFSQILLYPLNTSFLSNFNSLIEQVPE